MRRELATPKDTHEFGADLASILVPGDLLVLSGELGAGKTALTQGIGAGLDAVGAITSPTFIIARVHRGRIPLVHVDAYRLSGVEELDDLDLDVSLEESVTVVEWGAGLAERLSDAYLLIELVRRDDDVREVEISGHGGDWRERLMQWEAGATC